MNYPQSSSWNMNIIKSKFVNLFNKFQFFTNPSKQRIQEGVINHEQYNLAFDYKHSFTSNELSNLYEIFTVSDS